jgi:hypothetical protein
MNLKHLVVIILLIGIFRVSAVAQCCSPGNPAAGAASVGTIEKKSLRLTTFYRHSFSDTYYIDGNSKAEWQGAKANFNYIGEIITYGITKKLTVETEIGYFLNKSKKDIYQDLNTHGFATSVFSFKYNILKTKRELEITIGAGAKIPFTQEAILGEFEIPYPDDIQPSTHAFGYVGQLFISKAYPKHQFKIILMNRYETNYRNMEGYKFGDALFTSLFLSKSFLEKFTALVQVRNEHREIDKIYEDGIGYNTFSSTGSDVIFLSPQLSYTLPHKFNVAALVDFPISRNYKGTQLGPKYAIGVSVIKGFQF